tara:strand:- start:32 stop:454 length:423 start_codon:yes stop_codon:yes gene_type:complete
MTIELAIQRIETLEKQMTLLMADKIKDDKKVKKDKKQKKNDPANSSENDDPPKKKKTSGYLMHNASQRPALKEAMEKEIADANKIIDAQNSKITDIDLHQPHLKLKSTDVLSRLATAWKALDDSTRSKWNSDAALDNDTP